MTKQTSFDPYALLGALNGERVSYVVVGGFARVVHGSGETTAGLDIVPSLREENLRRLGRVLEQLEAPLTVEQLASSEPTTVATRAGELRIVSTPWGTRGYDDLRIRAVRENLGRSVRPAIASVVDCARMLKASNRAVDADRLLRLRRMMELERGLGRQRGLRSSVDRSARRIRNPELPANRPRGSERDLAASRHRHRPLPPPGCARRRDATRGGRARSRWRAGGARAREST